MTRPSLPAESWFPSCKGGTDLEREGIAVQVIDMYCVKPLDEEAVLAAAANSRILLTAEEHAPQAVSARPYVS